MQGKKQQLGQDMEQQIGSKLGKEYTKAVYCHSAYLTYMQSEKRKLITQLCLNFCDPMNCSLPGFSVYGILQARILKWVSRFLLQGIFPTQGSNPHPFCLLRWQVGSLPRALPGNALC